MLDRSTGTPRDGRPRSPGPEDDGSVELRLTQTRLDFYVDVTIYERDGRYMAAADLAEDSRNIGVGDTPQEAVRAALAALGEPYASEMADGVELGPSGP